LKIELQLPARRARYRYELLAKCCRCSFDGEEVRSTRTAEPPECEGAAHRSELNVRIAVHPRRKSSGRVRRQAFRAFAPSSLIRAWVSPPWVFGFAVLHLVWSR
jgi:hypothetical protein